MWVKGWVEREYYSEFEDVQSKQLDQTMLVKMVSCTLFEMGYDLGFKMENTIHWV